MCFGVAAPFGGTQWVVSTYRRLLFTNATPSSTSSSALPFLTSRPGVPYPPTTCTSLRISGWIAFLRLAATMGGLFDSGSALVQVFPLWLGTWASETPCTSLCASLLTPPPATSKQTHSEIVLQVNGRCCFGQVLQQETKHICRLIFKSFMLQ